MSELETQTSENVENKKSRGDKLGKIMSKQREDEICNFLREVEQRNQYHTKNEKVSSTK